MLRFVNLHEISTVKFLESLNFWCPVRTCSGLTFSIFFRLSIVWCRLRGAKERKMDNDLLCNFRKCRKRLNTHAWVNNFFKFMAHFLIQFHFEIFSCKYTFFDPQNLQVTSCSRILLLHELSVKIYFLFLVEISDVLSIEH